MSDEFLSRARHGEAFWRAHHEAWRRSEWAWRREVEEPRASASQVHCLLWNDSSPLEIIGDLASHHQANELALSVAIPSAEKCSVT